VRLADSPESPTSTPAVTALVAAIKVWVGTVDVPLPTTVTSIEESVVYPA